MKVLKLNEYHAENQLSAEELENWKKVEEIIMDNKSTFIEQNFGSPYTGIENISDPVTIYNQLAQLFDLKRKI